MKGVAWHGGSGVGRGGPAQRQGVEEGGGGGHAGVRDRLGLRHQPGRALQPGGPPEAQPGGAERDEGGEGLGEGGGGAVRAQVGGRAACVGSLSKSSLIALILEGGPTPLDQSA